MKQRWGVIALVAAISFVSGGALLQRGAGNVYDQARLFEDVLAHVSNYYVDSIGQNQLYQKAANGLLEELKDPYSVLLTGDDYKALTEETSGNYAGLGIRIDVRNGWITVVAPLPDTPADDAGIETGDQIIAVDGQSTEGWKNEQAVNNLRGKPGSTVHLMVRRPGQSDVLKFDVTRAEIHIKSVPAGTLFPGGVGYISLNPVAETSADELREQVTGMRAKGMKTMILDLRLNPGGLLNEGVDVADLFLNPGQEIVATRGRAPGSTRSFSDDARQSWPNMPIVVLVDEGTASAAEIIAGALQDHDRAVIIGTPTFGKGLVQTLYPMGPGTALKLTTARWYTPSGRTIQRVAKDIQDQFLMAQAEAGDVIDSTAVQEDTSVKARPIFHTDAGRVVRGGGGIVPDLIVRRDSLTSGEREFARALGDGLPKYRDVLTSFALDAKRNGSIKSADFAVTPAMLDQIYRRLADRGVELSRPVFDGASALISRQLSYEIARYVFGRQAEFLRRSANDLQMQQAIDLLRQAQNPKQLMQLAAEQPSGH